MLQRVAFAVVLTVVVAGCSDGAGPAPTTEDDFDDLGLTASETTGVIRGVVVDESIVPVQGITVRLLSSGAESVTDSMGRFGFSQVAAGTHFLNVTGPLHRPVQIAVNVEAGETAPDLVKVQVARRFAADPYFEQSHFTGFIQCGYQLPVITSQCVNDYTNIVVPGGVANELRTIAGDNRGYIGSVGPDWQTIVWDLYWEPSAQGTSERMGLLISHVGRTASDRFASVAGDSPVVVRMDVGVAHATQAGSPDMIPPEGHPELDIFASVRAAEGQSVGFAVQQEFEVFQHNFYFGSPPDPWSFVAGDPPPW